MPSAGFICVFLGKPSPIHPTYLEDIDFISCACWNCDAEEAIFKKAKDRWCLDPSVIGCLKYEGFVCRVAPQGRGSLPQQERLRAVWKEAKDSIGCRAGESLEVKVKLMVEGLKHVREAVGKVEDKIKEICMGFPEYSYILSIPGFGPDISSKIIGAIGNPFRFDNGRQVLKMAGMDLSAKRSGKDSDVDIKNQKISRLQIYSPFHLIVQPGFSILPRSG